MVLASLGPQAPWNAEQELRLPLPHAVPARQATSLRLLWRSERRSGARIDIALLDPVGAVVGRAITAAVDWIGENDLQLWLATFLDAGAPSEDASIAAVTLRPAKPGLLPTILGVDRLEITDTEPSWPVDRTDTVIEGGWHSVAAAPWLWSLERERSSIRGDGFVQGPEVGPESTGRSARLTWRGTAPWLTLGFRQEEEPGSITLVRDFRFPLAGYAELLIKAAWDRDTLLSVTAEVDGRELAVCRDEAPSDEFRTMGARLPVGEALGTVRVTLAERSGRPRQDKDVSVGLFWILLRRPSELDDLPETEVTMRLFGLWDALEEHPRTAPLRVRSVPFEEPAESRSPVGDPLRDGLPLGFFVTRETLPKLREKCLRGEARELFRRIRAEADNAVATELVDRNTYGNALAWGGAGRPKGFRGAGMLNFAPTTAFTHLITGEERYAVACRRWILRAAASDRWTAEHGGPSDRPHAGDETFYDDIFTAEYPQGFWGYMNAHFFVADAAYGITAAYDMLYHCFSADERERVEQAMARNGLFRLWDKMLASWDFYVRMNQGILIAVPLLMQTAFLRSRDPVYAELHATTLRFLEEFSGRPWSAEGVMGEGPAYGNGTFAELVLALPVMAACRGAPLRELLPASTPRIMEYLLHCRSTWRTPGSWPHFLGLSDGGEYGWISNDVLLFFARFLRDPVAEYLLRELEEPPHPTIANVLFTGSPPEPREPVLPPAHAYRDQPMLFYRTGWKPGESLVMMNAIRQVTCHGHKDRGTIIFEYGGEQLVMDPGMVGYSDPGARQYQETFCHNCLTLGRRSQLGGTQSYDVRIVAFESSSGPRCPGEELGIDWAVVDLTAVYPEARSYRRHLVFLRPDTVLLFDELELVEPSPAELNFTLLGPIRKHGGAFVSETASNRLLLCPLWEEGPIVETSLWGTHWPELQAHRLVLSAPAQVRTASWLTVLAAAERTAPVVVEPAGGACTALVRRPGRVESVWFGGDGTRPAGVPAGSLATVRRSRAVSPHQWMETRMEWDGQTLTP